MNANQPEFTAEFWVGWFDVWGGRHHFIGAQEKMADFEKMVRTGASFNLYMFHGGTTRGLMSGANLGRGYEPTTDGYDYAAPLDESGRPTEKYRAFRMVISRALPDGKPPEVPRLPAPVSLGDIALTEQCRWLDGLPPGEVREKLLTMEDLGQTTGMIAYRTTVEGPLVGELALGTVKDRVHVLLDDKLLGISGRSTRQTSVDVNTPAGEHRLDLIVENMGRINYGGTMAEERKGLTDPVLLGDRTLGPFEQVRLPLQEPPGGKFEKIEDGAMLAGPAVYRAKFQLGTTGDTWLDLRGFGRGMVWFNGRNFGRYWHIGPTKGIFLPGCWMKTGEENELMILELESAKPPARVRTSTKALWGSGGR